MVVLWACAEHGVRKVQRGRAADGAQDVAEELHGRVLTMVCARSILLTMVCGRCRDSEWSCAEDGVWKVQRRRAAGGA